jgi:hypothetical protein
MVTLPYISVHYPNQLHEKDENMKAQLKPQKLLFENRLRDIIVLPSIMIVMPVV